MNRLLFRQPLLRRSFAFSPFVLLLILTAVWSVFYAYMHEARDAVVRNREARFAAQEVISDLTDMETGQRGYLLMADDKYLVPYDQGRKELAADTLQLRRTMLSTPRQRLRYRELQRQIYARAALLDSTIILRKAGDHRGATDVIRSGIGKLHMDSIRGLITSMTYAESAGLEKYMSREEHAATLLVVGFVVGILLVGFVGVYTNDTIVRQAQRQHEWLQEIAHQNELLQEQQGKMEAQSSELESQNEELFTLNEELLQATHRAESANEAKTAFLMSMSHELRTPLNAIGGYTDLIDAGVYGDTSEAIREAARRIHVNQQQLLSVINQILDYTGLRAETNEVKLRNVDLAELARSVEDIVAPLIAEKGLRFHLVMPQEATLAWAHPERLRQVLINLLSNAIKFTDPPGDIILTCAQHDDKAQISVTDSGIGIAPDLLERIFEPFVQGTPRTTRHATAGVGLGLAISRELMRSMNGDISVGSVPGSGSTFTVTLPVVSALPVPPVYEASPV